MHSHWVVRLNPYVSVLLLVLVSQGPVSSSPPPATAAGKKEVKGEEEDTKKWAVPVDITSPCEDFYKRIPDPAFKVPILNHRIGPGGTVHSYTGVIYQDPDVVDVLFAFHRLCLKRKCILKCVCFFF